MTTNLATAIPPGAIDRTTPNSGLTIVFITGDGAAFWCLACNAGTGVGAYDLAKTCIAARMHREGSCPRKGDHHITRTGRDAAAPAERYRSKSNGSCGRWVRTDDSVAFCSCGWVSHQDTRSEARAAARSHRIEAHTAALAA